MYNAKSLKAEEFISDEEIRETLAYADANKDNVALIDEIIEKAKLRKGLNHREASVLLACEIPEKIQEVYALAEQIKKDFYGNRIVLFAPLYLSNYCVNGCVYCPYHLKNKHIARKKLTQEDIVKEVTALQDMGHKRLAIEAGEDPVNNPIEYILECIKTIYSINQGTNTEYVLNYLLEESGLTPGEDVTIEWKTSEEVTALMASGGIDLCMLPVPAATSVMMQNADVRDAIDLNDVWQDVGAAGTFTMGCVVARSDFVEEHPEAVDAFLTEYAASIAYVNEHPEEAAALIEQYGIVPKAAVAKAAIPQANMVCLTGDELKGISDYYEVLYAADPTSIGGAIPDDNFYYIP